MGKSGKLLTSLVNGVKAFKSPPTKEKSSKENSQTKKDRSSHTVKERDSLVTKHGCMWSLGKSSSRHKSSVGAPQHPGIEVKDVPVQQLTQGSHPPISSFNYTDASMDEITSTLVDEIVQEEPPPDESHQEDWAAILKLSDEESEPEIDPSHSSQRDEQAAVVIQAAIRRHLAQQSLRRTLRAVIRLQAVARGRTVRKQAATTLRCIHALVKFQANARGWLVRNSEVGQLVRHRLEEIGWQDQMLPVEEILSEKQNHSQLNPIALYEQSSTKQNGLVREFEPDKEVWGWAWLDRWMAARPWENSSSSARRKKSTAHGEMESRSRVYEGAQAIVADTKKQDSNFLQEKTSIPSANMLASHGIPAPPPPPPLPSFTTTTASHSIKQPVLSATKDSSENTSSDTPPITPITRTDFSEARSLCAPPKVPTEPAACGKITSFTEGSSVSSTPVSSEAPICTLAHPEEVEEFMPRGTPADLGAELAEVNNPNMGKSCSSVHWGASQAEVVNPSLDEAVPPASSFQQQRDSPSASSFTRKEEDWLQGSSVPALSGGENESDSAELGAYQTSVLNDEPVRLTNEEKSSMVSSSEASKPVDSLESNASGDRDVSILSKSEVRNLKTEEQETEETTNCDVLQGSKDMREGSAQAKGNGVHAPMASSEEPAKLMGSILVKHDQQGDAASQSLPSYMATTKSSKAKARSQASPRQMPESPKQRLVSPKHSSATKRTPTVEGKGTFANPRQIVHVRSGSKGQSASTIRDGSTSRSFRLQGDSKSPAK